jgi:hypothetical protein
MVQQVLPVDHGLNHLPQQALNGCFLKQARNGTNGEGEARVQKPAIECGTDRMNWTVFSLSGCREPAGKPDSLNAVLTDSLILKIPFA